MTGPAPQEYVDVLSRRDFPAGELARAGQLDVVTIYRVNGDPHLVFAVRMPKDKWNATTEQDAIRANEKARGVGAITRFSL